MAQPSSGKSGKARVHIFVSGKVQGVYYRQNTVAAAKNHGVTGWVRNLADGRVEAVLEGDTHAVEKVVEWCHAGPANAVVSSVDSLNENYTGEFKDFTINQ